MSAPLQNEPVEAGHSLWRDAWLRLRKNKMAVAGAIFISLLTIASFTSPWTLSNSYSTQDLQLGATPPGAAHWFGTDEFGRDLFARLLNGGRISLSVGLAATLVSVIIGVLYGTISGYLGGRVDAVMMRVVDILYSLPFTIIVILVLVICKDLGNDMEALVAAKTHLHLGIGKNWSVLVLFAVIGAVEWLDMARVVRGQVASLRKQEYIDAAIALGLRKRRIILRHVIPNVLSVVIICATLIVPQVMLLEAFLSFLGFGVQAPQASWGTLINDGARSMEEFSWLLVFPALFFSMTLFSLNFLGDGLRDALDVRASKD